MRDFSAFLSKYVIYIKVRAPENAGTWANMTRHIRNIADIYIFYSVFRISVPFVPRHQNQLLGHWREYFFEMVVLDQSSPISFLYFNYLGKNKYRSYRCFVLDQFFQGIWSFKCFQILIWLTQLHLVLIFFNSKNSLSLASNRKRSKPQ